MTSLRKVNLLQMKIYIGLIILCIGKSACGITDDPDAFLKKLRAELAKRGNPWIAGSTGVSHLPLEARRALLPGKIPLPQVKLKTLEKKSITFPPSSWDWRNVDGKCWLTRVKHQNPNGRNCGWCWAFGWIATLEARWNIANNKGNNADFDLSEQFIISCNTSSCRCGTGCHPYHYEIALNPGVPTEECFPFSDSDESCNNRCQDPTKYYKIIDHGKVDLGTPLKREIMENGPVVGYITIKEDFLYYKGGVYEPIMGEKSNHIVCIVGWTADGKWIFKNSYGKDWGIEGCYGEKGYGLIGVVEHYAFWATFPVSKIIQLVKVEFIEPNDGVWDPGEQVNIIVTLKAKGMDFPNVQGVLSTTESDITIDVGTYNFGTIIKDNSVNNSSSPYKVTASASASSPQKVSFNLRVTSNSGYSTDLKFEGLLGWVACAEISKFPNPSIHDSTWIYGMAFDGTNLWITELYSNKIYKLNQNGDLIGEISAPEIKCTGIDYDTQNNWLWVHNLKTKEIYKIDASTGSKITSFASPANSYPTGLAFDGEHLWAVDRDKYKIYKVQTSGTVVSSFSIPVTPQVQYGPRGLAYDPNGPSLILYMTHFDSTSQGWVLDSTVIYEISLDGRLTGKRCNTDGARGSGRLVCVDPKRGEYWVNGGKRSGTIRKIKGFHRVQGVEEDVVHPFISKFSILPNPSCGEVTIKLYGFKGKRIFVNIYDVAGRIVDCLAENKLLGSCEYRFKWDGVDLDGKKVEKGVYFCRIETPDFTRTKKFVIVR